VRQDIQNSGYGNGVEAVAAVFEGFYLQAGMVSMSASSAGVCSISTKSFSQLRLTFMDEYFLLRNS
jgi:hypothetical protein